MNDKPEREWLNLSEAAQLLGVHPSTVRMWADKGTLPMQRTSGGHRRFLRADLEAWSASQRRGLTPGASLIVQSALGRTRMDFNEGQLSQLAWYAKLSESARTAHRETSQRLLGLLQKYLANTERDATLTEARRLGIDYYRLGKASQLSLSESARAFLYFRDFLSESVVQMVETTGTIPVPSLAELHQLTAQFTNEVLIALIAAHEADQ